MSTEHLIGDIGLVLDALMGTADGPRQEAESHLRTLTVQSPAEVLLLLAQIGSLGVGGFQLDHRFLTLILLKRLSFTALPGLFLNSSSQHASAPFDVIAERSRARIESVLCAGLKDEINIRMRKGLGTCTASWAQESLARQRPCLTLPPLILDLTNSQLPFHRFTPFQLLNVTPTLLVDSVTEPLPAHQLAGLLMAGLNDPSMDVRVEAMKAMRSVLMEGLTGKERDEVGANLAMEAFKTLPQLPTNLLPHALEPLVDLASTHPNLFMPSLTSTLPYLLSLLSLPGHSLPQYPFSPYPLSTASYEDFEDVANPATELILSLAELRRAQFVKWENGRAGREMVGLLAGRLVAGLEDQGEDCKSWLEETNLDDEDESYPAYPEESLDRLAMAIGGETILPALSEHVQTLLRNSDWRCRYTALLAVASVAEGCLEEVRPRLPDVLGAISPSAKDPHPRVRYAFLQCLGQLCTDCRGFMQEKYPKQVLEICLDLLNDPTARVRAHAGACMCNFFSGADVPSFAAYLEPIVRTLIKAFRDGPLYIQEQVLATIATATLHAQAAFAPFYREAMDLALSVLTAKPDDKHKKLVGRAMECATSMGISVGKEIFAGDATKLAHILITIQNQMNAADDTRASYLMEAWSTLCRILGKDFTPFLTQVIPPLLRAASYKPSIAGESKLSLTDEDDSANVGLFNTAEMEEKVLAFDALTIYAFDMRAAFEPWLMPSMELVLEALVFPHSEDVRESAAFLVPALLQVAKESGAWKDSPGHLEQVFRTIFNTMAKEVDFGFLALLYKSFTDSLHVIATSLPSALLSHLLRTTMAHLDDLRARRQDRKAQEPYMDDGDLELFIEEEEEEGTCLDHMAKSMDMVLKFGESVSTEPGGELRIAVDGIWRSIGEIKSMALKVEP